MKRLILTFTVLTSITAFAGPDFRKPDIDPALLLDAEITVKKASIPVYRWMYESFDSLEKEFDQDLEVIKNDIEFRQELIEVRDRGLSALEHGDLQTGLDSIYKLGQLKEEARKVDEEMRKLEEKFNN